METSLESDHILEEDDDNNIGTGNESDYGNDEDNKISGESDLSGVEIDEEPDREMEDEEEVSATYSTGTTDIAYAVVGGNIYFNASTGTVTDCDYSETQAVIPSQISGVEVTVIGDEAFQGCYNLASVTIPNSVDQIGGEAFDGCLSLKSLTIPEGVESLGIYFIRDTSISSITIPSTVIDSGWITDLVGMDNGALAGCTTLKEVIL